ncbi:uncharacterized protein LOC114750922, partial [Neltuma alba]|uniref:uncharacterized protein LOC114750922 n=1 Tax=Neltuma alba TaxID=207710 RepID=UPI0010A2CE28
MLALPKANSETDHGCSVPNIDLQKCLNQSKNSLSIEDSCCRALNQIAEDGFKCLCSLITATPITLVGPPLSLPFLNCFISIPPLSLCPASLAPMAVLVAPESQEEQNQLSSPADADVVVSHPPPTNLTVDDDGGGGG